MSEQQEALTEALRASGLSDRPDLYDSSIHSWRCEHPDRYGPCDCFAELATDLACLLADAEQRGVAMGEANADTRYTETEMRAAEQRGVDRVAAAVEGVLREYDPCCPPEGCGCTKCDLVDDLRAALAAEEIQ